MTPLSERIAKLEERLNKRLERWKAKHSADWRLYAVLGGMGWYFYGMIVNSVRLGIRQSFDVESNIASIWVVNPFRNLIAPFTLTGLGLTDRSPNTVRQKLHSATFLLSYRKYRSNRP